MIVGINPIKPINVNNKKAEIKKTPKPVYFSGNQTLDQKKVPLQTMQAYSLPIKPNQVHFGTNLGSVRILDDGTRLFHHTYFGGSILGNLNFKRVFEFLSKHFDEIAPGKDPVPVRYSGCSDGSQPLAHQIYINEDPNLKRLSGDVQAYDIDPKILERTKSDEIDLSLKDLEDFKEHFGEKDDLKSFLSKYFDFPSGFFNQDLYELQTVKIKPELSKKINFKAGDITNETKPENNPKAGVHFIESIIPLLNKDKRKKVADNLLRLPNESVIILNYQDANVLRELIPTELSNNFDLRFFRLFEDLDHGNPELTDIKGLDEYFEKYEEYINLCERRSLEEHKGGALKEGEKRFLEESKRRDLDEDEIRDLEEAEERFLEENESPSTIVLVKKAKEQE